MHDFIGWQPLIVDACFSRSTASDRPNHSEASDRGLSSVKATLLPRSSNINIRRDNVLNLGSMDRENTAVRQQTQVLVQ